MWIWKTATFQIAGTHVYQPSVFLYVRCNCRLEMWNSNEILLDFFRIILCMWINTLMSQNAGKRIKYESMRT